MLYNRTRISYSIYEKEAANVNYSQKEYCVLSRKNGKTDLWGQINVIDNGDVISMRVRYPNGYITLDNRYDLADKQKVKYIQTYYFLDDSKQAIGTMYRIRPDENEPSLQIVDYGNNQVIAKSIPSSEVWELEFSDDDHYNEKVSPWYFRHFDDPLMATMIDDEGAFHSQDKFKERYGVSLPGDISGQLTSILLLLPFVY